MPNGHFEQYSTCPDYISTMDPGGDQLHYCTGWTPILTPDYYNACCLNESAGVPVNYCGYQTARSGDAYCGFLTYWPLMFWREFIQTKLTEPLIPGKEYTVSFHLSLADHSAFASRGLGIYFSKLPLWDDHFVTDSIPQVVTNDYISDTSSWTEVTGSFVAKGGEQYLTIGRFGDPGNSDTLRFNYSYPASLYRIAYYYVDDVEVCCNSYMVYMPNIFSPNGDGNNDEFNIRGEDILQITLGIYNRWGNAIFESSDIEAGWDGRYHGMDCPEGVYFYIVDVVFMDGTKDIKKGSFTLVR